MQYENFDVHQLKKVQVENLVEWLWSQVAGSQKDSVRSQHHSEAVRQLE